MLALDDDDDDDIDDIDDDADDDEDQATFVDNDDGRVPTSTWAAADAYAALLAAAS